MFYKTFTEISKDFFKKFANIDKIEISNFSRRPRKCKSRHLPDASYVLQLLVQTNPRDVEISYLNYNENHSKAEMKEFYEQLTSIQSIEWLLIRETNVENIDYDYFLKLKYLDRLSIFTEKLPINFIENIFKNTFINDFSFHCSNFYITFDRHPGYFVFNLEDRIGLPGSCKNRKVFYALDDLTEYVKRLKSENRGGFRDHLSNSV